MSPCLRGAATMAVNGYFNFFSLHETGLEGILRSIQSSGGGSPVQGEREGAPKGASSFWEEDPFVFENLTYQAVNRAIAVNFLKTRSVRKYCFLL